jgi:hypothetical protein
MGPQRIALVTSSSKQVVRQGLQDCDFAGQFGRWKRNHDPTPEEGRMFKANP